ncbi:hypothetical protein [Paeniglutamicibacter kerguelensis]|uniref:Uncharacterized protein n=1 Tax=Paeniglutamicibacter kerguelensis TaxID=254788 RepID=A0ABS4XBJ4_9MICC|nr:hypothetical protein [Paeniglutamicibacter kerguelensis]MBP2385844.1 hypothetical protein [Paeniglutamicibacter kerguelensis]
MLFMAVEERYVEVSDLICEVHFPLVISEDVVSGDLNERFPWVEVGEEWIEDLEDLDPPGVAEWDTSDAWSSVPGGETDEYVYYLTGDTSEEMLAAARTLASLEGMPAGAYAILGVSDPLELGEGQKVQLS